MNPLQSGAFNLNVAGFRDVPPGGVQSAAYTLSNLDVGRIITTTANVTIPASGFMAGNAIVIYNNSSSQISLVTTGTIAVQTAYISGQDVNRGASASGGGANINLIARGLATIIFTGPNSCVVSGNVT
jgi:hypothetical protein